MSEIPISARPTVASGKRLAMDRGPDMSTFSLILTIWNSTTIAVLGSDRNHVRNPDLGATDGSEREASSYGSGARHVNVFFDFNDLELYYYRRSRQRSKPCQKSRSRRDRR